MKARFLTFVRLLVRSTVIGLAFGFEFIWAQQAPVPKTIDSKSEYQHKYALVIGNSNYRFLPKLVNPVNDALDMCSKLQKLGFETFCFENQRSKRAMKDSFIRFSQKIATAKGVALVFYAGHGIQVKGENYLIPVGAELQTEADMEDEAINVNYLMAQLDSSKNPFNIVILDACRNDPISRGWRSASRGLAPIDAPAGSVIIFSTAPGKTAFDGTGRNGLFTKHLLSNLEEPGLSLEEMIKQVSRSVLEESSSMGISQTPWWNSSFTGKFCFGGCANTVQASDLDSIRKEKERLEEEVRRARLESLERQKVLTLQETQSKAMQSELEARIKKLESDSLQSAQRANSDNELAIAKQQLEKLQIERQKLEATQRQQQSDIVELSDRRKELNQKAEQIESMSKKLVELENEKKEK
jgi:uncharacterized caspase-like protein